MKRGRALSYFILDNEVLDLKSIIVAIAPEPICLHLTNNRFNQENLKFKFNVYPDATISNIKQAEGVDKESVLVKPTQYELLINTHSKVLTARLKDMDFGFKLNTGHRVSYGCTHCSLVVNEEGYAEWEVLLRKI